MSGEIYWRAKTILHDGHVRFEIESSAPPILYHFKVKQRNEKWIDVFLRVRVYNGLEIKEWSCNAVTEQNGKKWGCVFDKRDRTKPQCSHTMACDMLIEKLMERV